MKITKVEIRNFRRLENVSIDFEDKETIFVGPNNSGKTSTASLFRCFLSGKDFRIYDFSVSKIPSIDEFGYDISKLDNLPTIELDLWFSIDPNHISFGRAFSLLPELSPDLNKVGLRIKYQPRKPLEMHKEYTEAFPVNEDGNRSKSLSQFLGIDTNLKRHYETKYFSLDDRGEVIESVLSGNDGKSLLDDLIRVDFVDAQRSMDDDEASRSNRLSHAFSVFYKENLEQAEAEQSAYEVIDDNNRKLTDHYEKHFSGLMGVIKALGVPSINDRDLKIVSSLSPLDALKGSTDLLYIDSEHKHELPESYNGLGFKNLIFMAIQISHFHLQWMNTEQKRPLIQLIFIEEPEVHLHAQVQQTFISNIWEIISKAAETFGQEQLVPQFVVSTHSAHVLDTVDFLKVRYFERCELEGEDRQNISAYNASKVHSLRSFQPEVVNIEGITINPEEAKRFLMRYLRLTHCDLFFADAAILVEGTVEKLLIPKMLEKEAPKLRTKYLSILEVGGAYAHRFEGLLSFLNIPYIVITDLDSVDSSGNHPVCRGDTSGAFTSNASLKHFFDINTVEELLVLSDDEKSCDLHDRYITFQNCINVNDEKNTLQMTPRTIEEAFAYENFSLLRSSEICLGIDIPESLEDSYEAIYTRIKSSSFKKTNFSLDILSSECEWITPKYIADGLCWLEQRLEKKSSADDTVEQ